MGKDNLDQQQPSEPIQIKPELVDFLYIDSERVDSFISQIKNGTLRSVSKTNATLQGSSSNAGVEANIKILKGSIGAKEQIDNSVSSTENYDPFHKQVIDLTITTSDGSKVSGTIIEEYLKIPMGSILKNYGTTLPGNWVVIGMFDTTTPQLSSDPDTESTVEGLVDTYSDTLKNFFAASTTKVIPLIIFRTINI